MPAETVLRADEACARGLCRWLPTVRDMDICARHLRLGAARTGERIAVKHGSVMQIHTRSCPRAEGGGFAPHRCKGSWRYTLEYGRDSSGARLHTSEAGFPRRAHFKRPKSKAGRRWVPLAPPPRAALEAHRFAQNDERAMFGPDYDEHDLVFCEVDGKPIPPGAVTTAFEEHVRACDLPVVRLHDTRHGACSLLLAGGVPIEVVQMILGHASPEVTRRVYAHVMRHAAAEQVEAATQLLTIHRL